MQKKQLAKKISGTESQGLEGRLTVHRKIAKEAEDSCGGAAWSKRRNWSLQGGAPKCPAVEVERDGK